MKLIDSFQEEYRNRFKGELGNYMENLGFRRVVFRLSLDGNSEDLIIEGPGYSPSDRKGYENLQTILKEMKQKYKISLEMEKRSW